MTQTNANKPRLGEMVKSNPNYQKLKQAAESYFDQNCLPGGGDVHWLQPKAFAEMYDFRDFDSNHFWTCYYKLKKIVQGEYYNKNLDRITNYSNCFTYLFVMCVIPRWESCF